MVAEDTDQPTAFRAAEKRYQLHKEQKIHISKGRKHGGKLVVCPTDFSDVLDLRTHNSCTPELIHHHSQLLGKTVYSLKRHPGCHIISGLLNDRQQLDLFRDSLIMFPEPPNRSNLTAHHGRLSSLWAAAQQGLFLQPNLPHKDSRAQLAACTHTLTDSQGSTADTQRLQPEAHAASTPTQNSAAACLCDPDNIYSGRRSGRADISNQQQNANWQCLSCPQGTPANSTNSCESVACQSQQESQASCHQQHEQLGRWQSAPGGPSANSLLHKLRWVALGPQFNWSTRQYEQEPGVQPLPPQLVSLAQHVVKTCQEHHVYRENGFAHSPGDDISASPPRVCHSVPCGVGDQCSKYEPDTALVNFYREGDTLGGHKDDAELHVGCPIVSLSLGCDAIFLIGGATKDVVPTPVWLHSGDAVVLAGAARQCYHGVPRVVPCRTLFDCCVSKDSAAVAKDMAALQAYMQSTRVNISIRQV